MYFLFLSDEGPMLETLYYTIRIGSTLTILYFDKYRLVTSTKVIKLVIHRGAVGPEVNNQLSCLMSKKYVYMNVFNQIGWSFTIVDASISTVCEKHI